MSINTLSRRKFLEIFGLGGIGVGVVACSQASAAPVVATATSVMDMPMTPTAPSIQPTQPVQPTGQADMAAQMDQMHEAGVKAFPAKTAGAGLQPLTPEMDGDVKVFRLTASVIQWEFAPGQTTEAFAYNGMVPGPEIRVTEGDKVRVMFTNQMPQSTAVHFHGLHVPNKMDGVPFITQPPVKTGETFIHEFVAKPFGSHMYHSHHNAAEQVSKGLLGPFIVEPKDKSQEPAYDKEYTIVMNDGPMGFTLNGKQFPATTPLTAKIGQKIRIRFMQEGSMQHPMHLHGMFMTQFAQDGYPLPYPHQMDTIDVASGQRKDVIIDCENPGVWAFHCHILPHAESSHGMWGMVTALIIES